MSQSSDHRHIFRMLNMTDDNSLPTFIFILVSAKRGKSAERDSHSGNLLREAGGGSKRNSFCHYFQLLSNEMKLMVVNN
jgi:hypothetical protein